MYLVCHPSRHPMAQTFLSLLQHQFSPMSKKLQRPTDTLHGGITGSTFERNSWLKMVVTIMIRPLALFLLAIGSRQAGYKRVVTIKIGILFLLLLLSFTVEVNRHDSDNKFIRKSGLHTNKRSRKTGWPICELAAINLLRYVLESKSIALTSRLFFGQM